MRSARRRTRGSIIKRKANDTDEQAAQREANNKAQLKKMRQARADEQQLAYVQQCEAFDKAGKSFQDMDILSGNPVVMHLTLMYFLRHAPDPDQYMDKGKGIANDRVVHRYTGPGRKM